MALSRFLGGWWDSVLSIGEEHGESEIHRGKRRVVAAAFVLAALARFVLGAFDLIQGRFWVGVIGVLVGTVLVIALVVLELRPDLFVWVVSVPMFLQLVEPLSATVLLGGLVSSDLVILYGLLTPIGALIAVTVRAAYWWAIGFIASLVLAVALPQRIEPLYPGEGTPGSIAITVAVVTVFLFGATAYFVRQRDRFQAESDDLLRNILPDAIATRLKSSSGMIADSYGSASVLFADVVDFTPMSADMSPHELVGLLNNLFSTFDRFVEELHLEKIKTVGDEYMVAAGVPTERSDHAQAIAELALRIRDELATTRFDGRQIQMRIGIHSGPVVAGIIGTHRFAYDLWGDAVNIASRMESEGIEGAIQVSEACYLLIKDDFICEPRGQVPIKGKGELPTYLLISHKTGFSIPQPTSSPSSNPPT